MKFYVLASGSKGNAFILQDQGITLMIDCGSTKSYLKKCFNELQLTTNDIDALLITHNHDDHISQLKQFHSRLIYTPVPLVGVRHCLISANNSYEIAHLKITALPLSHDSGINVGYVIENTTEKLVYVTDTGYFSSKNQKLIQNADYYIFESNHDPELLMNSRYPYQVKQRILSVNGHLCNQDAAEILANAVTTRSKEIILAHLSQEANDHELAELVLKKRLNGFAIKVQTAKQFEIVTGGQDE